MRNALVPTALAIVLAGSSLAMAATAPQSVTSTVKAYDSATHMLTLANGIDYTLPTTFKNPRLKVGERVTVKWEMNGTTHKADSVVID